jgi:ATP citrate (pro-S)-lyase
LVWLQGAKSGGDEESAQTKNKALADAGAIVPTSFEGFEATIKATYDSLVFTQNRTTFAI